MVADLCYVIPAPALPKNRNLLYIEEMILMLYGIASFPEFDAMFSERFGRPVTAWRLFRNIIRRSQEGEATGEGWLWDPVEECGRFSATPAETLKEFATVALHEATHGVCYFLHDGATEKDRFLSGGDHEEEFCWRVSRLVCEKIKVAFDRPLVDLLLAFFHATQAQDCEAVCAANEALPNRHRVF